MRINGIIFCFILLVVIVILSGCTSSGTTGKAAPPPIPVITPVLISIPTSVPYDNNATCRNTYGAPWYFNVVTNRCDLPTTRETPTPAVARAEDPVIGVWRLSNLTGYDDRYHFYTDGTYVESFFDAVYYGTWYAKGGNSYVTLETGTRDYEIFIYSPVQNAIYSAKYPSLLLHPFQGDVKTASTSPSVPAWSPDKALYKYCYSLGYCYSGYGDGVVQFSKEWGGRLTTFNMNYTGKSYFRVILKDETGGYISQLADEIGPYSGKKSVLLYPTDEVYIPLAADEHGPNYGKNVEILVPTITRKYSLEVHASGPWTITKTDG